MRTVIETKKAPEAGGNYSQAVKAGNLLFLSGQISVNPKNGIMERESVAAQTLRCMENMKAIVEAAGATMDDVVSCRVFLSDMKHFSEFDEIYGRFFSKPYPARMTVSTAGIYDNLDIELDAVVYLPNA